MLDLRFLGAKFRAPLKLILNKFVFQTAFKINFFAHHGKEEKNSNYYSLKLDLKNIFRWSVLARTPLKLILNKFVFQTAFQINFFAHHWKEEKNSNNYSLKLDLKIMLRWSVLARAPLKLIPNEFVYQTAFKINFFAHHEK